MVHQVLSLYLAWVRLYLVITQLFVYTCEWWGLESLTLSSPQAHKWWSWGQAWVSEQDLVSLALHTKCIWAWLLKYIYAIGQLNWFAIFGFAHEEASRCFLCVWFFCFLSLTYIQKQAQITCVQFSEVPFHEHTHSILTQIKKESHQLASLCPVPAPSGTSVGATVLTSNTIDHFACFSVLSRRTPTFVLLCLTSFSIVPHLHRTCSSSWSVFHCINIPQILVRGIWIVSSFWKSWIMLLWTFMYVFRFT